MPKTENALVLSPTPPASGNPPSSLAEVTSLGKLFAASGFFADARQAAQACAKILAGVDLGLGAYASMAGIYIVKGRVTLSANLMAAVVQKSARFRYRILEHTPAKCSIRFDEFDDRSKAWEEVGTSTFTQEDAKLAGLTSNDTYRKFPKNMMFARAMSNGAKWYVPSLFGGSPPYLPDEIPGSPAAMHDDGEYSVPAPHDATPPTAEIDDSGREEAMAELRALLASTGVAEERVNERFRTATLDDLSGAQLAECLTVLRGKKAGA